jgi:hypothetical protein
MKDQFEVRSSGFKPGSFMVTRPKLEQPPAPERIGTEGSGLRAETRCPRQRFFVETRRRDDGDTASSTRRKVLVLKLSATVREASAHGRKSSASIMNNAG